MNKQIEELAEQAGNKRINDYYTNGTVTAFTDIQLQKFAELIVQECAKVSEDDITDGDACCTNTADRIARQIKKHFGVEQ